MALCLIARRPVEAWCEFLNSFKSYKVFIVVDDNTFNCAPFRAKYRNLNFLQQSLEAEVAREGYRNLNFMVRKEVTSWEKAMHHFVVQPYPFVWFMEDDVYLYGEETLERIDREDAGKADLLSSTCKRNIPAGRSDWFWPSITANLKLPPPYCCGMMCAVRMSRAMLDAIRAYAEQHRSLEFLEVFFPTLAEKRGLVHHTPTELGSVTFSVKHYWLDPRKLYHPFKNMAAHPKLREAQHNLVLAAAEAVQTLPVPPPPPPKPKGRSKGSVGLMIGKV
jgi:hypothetical protein